MADKPITIKDSNHNFNTTRQEFMNDNNRKQGGSGKMTFHKYKTDKERVEEYLQEKKQNQKQAFKQINITSKENFSSDKEKQKKSESGVKQPIMRFKARTDLERIFYAINSFSYGKVSKDALNQQLQKLDLYDKPKENSDTDFLAKYENLDDKQIEELVSQKEFLNNQGYNEKNSETVKQITQILDFQSKKLLKIEDDPSRFQSKQAWKSHVNRQASQKFLSEYSQKTHFKAASVFSFNLDEYKTRAFNGSCVSKIKINKDAFGDRTDAKKQLQQDQQKKSSFRNNYLNFNYYDEPGHSDDEYEEEKNGYHKNNNYTGNFDHNYKSNGSNRSQNNGDFDNKFNKTSNNFSQMNTQLFKTFNNYNKDKKENVQNIPLKTFDFNPYDCKSQEFDYEPKSLVYLKRLSHNKPVAELNEENKNGNSDNPKNLGFLAHLKKKMMNIIAMKNETSNNFLKDITVNEPDDNRKCNNNFLNLKKYNFVVIGKYL